MVTFNVTTPPLETNDRAWSESFDELRVALAYMTEQDCWSVCSDDQGRVWASGEHLGWLLDHTAYEDIEAEAAQEDNTNILMTYQMILTTFQPWTYG